MKTLKESLKSLTTVNNISFRCFCRIVVFTIFFWNFFTFIAFCGTNYYEVESPYKMALQKNYDMEEEEHNANDRFKSFSKDEFDYIVIDECHHAVADSYKKIIEHLKRCHLL